MKIYKVYRDFSDPYEQSYKDYGYYLSKEKAIKELERIVREEESEDFDESKLDYLREYGAYGIEWLGYYGISEIYVNDEVTK